MDVLGRWISAFAHLRDGETMACPSCGAQALRWCTEGSAAQIGHGAIWCDHCGLGTWISRLPVREGDISCADVEVPTFDDVSG